VSAPGQGSLAIQVRTDDARATAAVGRLDDPATRVAVEAERALLNATGGGCRSPIGAIGVVSGGRLELVAAAEREWAPAPDAPIMRAPVVRVRGEAPSVDRAALVERLAARIVAMRQVPRVLLARAAGQADLLLAALQDAGVAAVNVPAIEILPAVPDGALDEALVRGEPGDWLVITSRNAAVATVEAVIRTGIDPHERRWAAMGVGTAAVLGAAGIGIAFRPSPASAGALAGQLPLTTGDHIVLPRSDIADATLPEALRARGAAVAEVVAYRTVEGPESSRIQLAAALDDGPIDALVLTSGSTVRGLLALAIEAETDERLRRTPVVAIGEPTAAVARSLGFTTVLAAPSPAAGDLAAFVASSLGFAPSSTRPSVLADTHTQPATYAAGLTPGGAR
jgi:uroporphyrinogen-III synthase